MSMKKFNSTATSINVAGSCIIFFAKYLKFLVRSMRILLFRNSMTGPIFVISPMSLTTSAAIQTWFYFAHSKLLLTTSLNTLRRSVALSIFILLGMSGPFVSIQCTRSF
jgi:hypothetical protein